MEKTHHSNLPPIKADLQPDTYCRGLTKAEYLRNSKMRLEKRRIYSASNAKQKMQKATRQFVETLNRHNVAITITLKQTMPALSGMEKMTEIRAENVALQIKKRLNRKFFSRRGIQLGLTIGTCFVVEGAKQHRFDASRYHLHGSLEIPDNVKIDSKLLKEIEEVIRSIPWVHKEVLAKEIFQRDCWAKYITKEGADKLLLQSTCKTKLSR